MNNFVFYSPTEFVFGKNTEVQVGALARKYGAQKVMIVYGGGSVVRSGLLDRVKQSLQEAKKGFFCLIKSFYINGIHLVIGIYAHPVIRNAEYEKRQQRHCQLTGCGSI